LVAGRAAVEGQPRHFVAGRGGRGRGRLQGRAERRWQLLLLLLLLLRRLAGQERQLPLRRLKLGLLRACRRAG
jgi:hypothetical protein